MGLLDVVSSELVDDPEAVRVADRVLSGADLLGSATAVADRIQGAGVVALHATSTVETVVGLVGALLAGVPIVPVPPDAGIAERTHILRDSGATILLAGPEAGDTMGAVADAAGNIGNGGVGGGGARGARVSLLPVDLRSRSATAVPEPDPDQTALILYTSGTTGAPKGALISRAAVVADLDALAAAWAWTPDDVLVHGLPLFHVHGLVLGVLGPLRVGSRLVHTGRPRPAAYAAAGGTVYFGVPTVWSRMCADPAAAAALAGSRLLVSGSAPLPVPVFTRLAELTGHRPVERYGMTETLITVSGRADGERRPGFVGTPVAGVETRVVADDGGGDGGRGGGDVPRDGVSIGELLVRGPTLFSGYLNRPDATARSLDSAGWFHTGDVATIGADGWHRIVGRASTDLIKSGGYRIGAGEVEDALLAHPGVREAAVVGAPDPDLGERVVAYVVADGVGSQQLIDFVAGHLSVHKRPREVHLLTGLPRNAMGKVQKQLLNGG